jgi:hypothetical protein
VFQPRLISVYLSFFLYRISVFSPKPKMKKYYFFILKTFKEK